MPDQGRDRALLALLAAGETRSEALAAGLRVPTRTVQYRLARLREQGLVASASRGAWPLTGAGQRAALDHDPRARRVARRPRRAAGRASGASAPDRGRRRRSARPG